jgi:hypothetical protein
MSTHIHAYRAIKQTHEDAKKRFLEDDDEKKSPHL